LLNRRSDLTPDGGALVVALASENRSPGRRAESGFIAVPVDDELGGPVDVNGVGHGRSDRPVRLSQQARSRSRRKCEQACDLSPLVKTLSPWQGSQSYYIVC